MSDIPSNSDSVDVHRTMADPPTVPGPIPEGLVNVTTQPYAPTAPDERTEVPELASGALVGKYQIVEPIKGGGMGFVYRAYNPDLKSDVALKVIRGGDFGRPDVVRRFTLECEALARFRHPHIVAIYDAGQYRGRPFLVMEYLPGGSLAQHAERFRGDQRASVALIEKVARAIEQLHAGGVLHRDLKPGNVLLDEQGEPRVADFGLVKLLDGSGDELTETGHRPGTPAYMAPEQIEYSQATLGPPTDVWALGVMLYELLLSRHPFGATARSALLQKIASSEPDLPRSLRPGFDPELEAVVLKCLRKSPARRFASAGELADELSCWLKGQPTRTRPEGRLRRLARVARRHPWQSAVMLLLALLATAAAVWFFIPDRDRHERAIRRTLKAGFPAVLIPETGSPKWSEVALGAPAESLGRDGFFTVEAWEPVLLVLARTTECKEYRVRAKVRHERGDPAGSVGIFIGHHSVASPHGSTHLCLPLCFNDMVDHTVAFAKEGGQPGPSNPARFDFWLAADIGDNKHQFGRSGLASVRFQTPGAARDWRQLELTVRSNKLMASFDGKPTQPVELDLLTKRMGNLLESLAGADPMRQGFLAAVNPAFEPSGALGIYVEGSQAAFAEFVVTPIHDE